MGAVVFSSYSEFMEGGERWSAAALSAYDTLARSAWGIAVSWVIFACHYGHGGVCFASNMLILIAFKKRLKSSTSNKQEKPTNCGTNAADVLDKFFS